jgi:hypothetical protein
MPGGLLNLISYGNQNIILNGNPSKTFFKSVYAKYSNFGLQNIRIDFNGQKTLKLNEDSHFTFKVPRNAELLLDTFLVFNIPDIWSPIMPPAVPNQNDIQNDNIDVWKPYNFKWIEYLGTNIIKKITLSIGSLVIQSYSGQYIQNMVERDFDASKKELFYKMIGMTDELTNPKGNNIRVNDYPNAYYTVDSSVNNIPVIPDPSIRGRKIYVPLHFWFSYSSKMALPLVCLQYSEVTIDVILRPINDLYRINDVSLKKSDGFDDNTPIRPNVNNEKHSFYRFIQAPPDEILTEDSYTNKTYLWNTDIHLIGTYCFLSEEEATVFAKNEQKYLIKDIKEDKFTNIIGTKRIKVLSNGMAATWMWYFQRNDIVKRNEWSNYTNWTYNNTLPYNLLKAPETSNDIIISGMNIGPGKNIKYNLDLSGDYIYTMNDTTTSNGTYLIDSYYNITPKYNKNHIKNILNNVAIIFDGKYRENVLDSGVYNYIEKYKMSNGNSDDGLYIYNYCLNTNPYELQPSGAINLSKFKTIELEFETHLPPFDNASEYFSICDNEGNIVGNTKNSNLYIYSYDLTLVEERYNIVRFVSGQAGLVYTR